MKKKLKWRISHEKELISSYPNDDASKIKKIAESINQRYDILKDFTNILQINSYFKGFAYWAIMQWPEEKRFMEGFHPVTGKISAIENPTNYFQIWICAHNYFSTVNKTF